MQIRVVKRATILVITLLLALPLSGQKAVNSPYARFNLGILETRGSSRSAGMGGLSVVLRDNSSFSFTNPASYSAADTNSFLFDFGMEYGLGQLSDGQIKRSSDDLNFHHLAIMFPITKGWGFGLGVVPVSNGYYNISQPITEGHPLYDPIAGDLLITHRGEGSFTKAFAGTGFHIARGLSAGLNAGFLFGEIERFNEYAYVSDNNLFDSRMQEKLSLRGIGLEAGLQYLHELNDDRFVIIGASYRFQNSVASDHSSMFVRFASGFAAPGVPYAYDTLSYSDIEGGEAILPQRFSGGVGFGIRNRLMAGVDFHYSDWTQAEIMGNPGSLAPKRGINAGLEYIPDRFALQGVFNRMEYRLGGRLTESYIAIGDEQVNEFGITFGVGIPIRRSWSKANFYVDYSRRGATRNGLHIENLLTFGLSVNLYDYWFIQRRYD